MSTQTSPPPSYELLGPNWKETECNGKTINLDECCLHPPGDDPNGCDCCYDTWNDSLKLKQKEYGTHNEIAAQLKAQLEFYKNRRDGIKKWKDELLTIDESSRELCNQFDLIVWQVEKICRNTGFAVEAIEILFCMIRDFYSQIDQIKIYYDYIDNCIKCLNSEVMVPDKGIVKCLKMYYEKLDAVLKLKEPFIKLIMEAIKFANLLNENICHHYGLKYIINEWKDYLNCVEPCKPDPCSGDPCAEKNKKSESSGDNSCVLEPRFSFPLCNDEYMCWLKTQYEADVNNTTDFAARYLEESKKKEAITACIDSLKAATKEANPNDRCK